MLLLELVSLYVFLALSLWAFFRKEIKAQFTFLLAASLGWFLLVGNEFAMILGDSRFLYTAAYLCFSIASLAHRLMTHHPILLTGFVKLIKNTQNTGNLAAKNDQTRIRFNPLVQEAQRILDEL